MRLITMMGAWIYMALFTSNAYAEFIITSAILEFSKDSPRQQDIELVSRSKNNDYIVSEISEILHPDTPEEKRVLMDDPSKGGLLVTPDKTILNAGSRKVLRFVLLKEPDDKEHIYRVAIKPVIKGVDNNSRLGLKVLVGYEALVIIRPISMAPHYTAVREGKKFTVTNNGNTNILFQNGQQCSLMEQCKLPPVLRSYPGTVSSIDLPIDKPISYNVWDGQTTKEEHFN